MSEYKTECADCGDELVARAFKSAGSYSISLFCELCGERLGRVTPYFDTEATAWAAYNEPWWYAVWEAYQEAAESDIFPDE